MKVKVQSEMFKFLMGLAIILFAVSCTEIEEFDPQSMDADQIAKASNLTGPLVEPILWSSRGRPDSPGNSGGGQGNAGNNGGNVECSEVGDFEFSSGRNAIEDGKFEMDWPEGFEVSLNEDGSLNWSFTAPEGFCLESMTVIVKGGPDANLFDYTEGQTSDNKLTAPINPNNNNPYGISNVTFCYNLEAIPEEPEVEGDADCFEEGLKLTAKVTSEIPEGVVIKWYDQEVGGNEVADPSLDKVGSVTYWAEAVRGNCASARVPVTLEIYDLPAAPVSNGDQDEEACDGLNELTASVQAVDGVSIVWYDSEKEGTEVADPTLVYDPNKGGVQSVSFYAEAVNDETGCISPERTKVTLTLRECPDTPPTGECAAGTAFAGEELIRNQGWFYLMDYDGSEVSYTLWSSQTFDAGKVTLTPNGNMVDIKVELNAGYSLKDGDNWYVHGYTTAPTSRPVGGDPGTSVTYAKGSAASAPINITVPRNGATTFAVHVNVVCD